MNEKQDRELHLANEAQRLIHNPLFEDAFAALSKKYITAWRNSMPAESKQREQVYWLLTCLDQVKAELTSHITTGKLIAKELESEAYRRQMEDSHPDGSSAPSATV